jgi:serine/threonine-protein kinase
MIGRLLDGRYRVGPRIARGGMATVYEATDQRLDRVCALKIMHSNLGDDQDFAGRFVREARSAARLSHPHVVAVFDQGDDNGTLFLAMEYIPGHTLRDLVRKEAPMAPAKALSLVEPVLSALSAAHQAGLIHRDVKPENVLLAEDGRVKVADFGLARAVSAETQHTGTGGVLIGTVSYLAPELVIDGRADARSDVYAVGVLMYEMLTGRKPHEGDSPIQVAYKHVHEDVPPPSRDVPGIPAYVDALVARATARDRELRPADARVLLHQVRRVRGALDHGILDDPELTSDLAPTSPVRLHDSIDYVREDAPRIVEPASYGSSAASAEAPESEGTTVLGGALPRTRPSYSHEPDDRGGGSRSDDRPAQQHRRSRRGPVLLAVVLMLAVLAGLTGWYYGMGRYTSTPGVINLSAAQAREKVVAAGLHFVVGSRQFSETVAAGSVVSTDPAAGSRILENGTVSAVVSKGPERYEVPRMRGMTEEQARQTLTNSHLTFGDATRRYDAQIAAGVVVFSEPKAGTELQPNSAVDLVVSKGPRPIDVPDFTGQSARKAIHTLEGLGLKVDVSRTYDDTVPGGAVIAQDPASGTLFRGDTVQLQVSKGPTLVAVPDVRRMGVDEATRTMQAAGFQVQTQNSSVYEGIGFVVDTDPKAGTLAPRGSLVTLFLV